MTIGERTIDDAQPRSGRVVRKADLAQAKELESERVINLHGLVCQEGCGREGLISVDRKEVSK